MLRNKWNILTIIVVEIITKIVIKIVKYNNFYSYAMILTTVLNFPTSSKKKFFFLNTQYLQRIKYLKMFQVKEFIANEDDSDNWFNIDFKSKNQRHI